MASPSIDATISITVTRKGMWTQLAESTFSVSGPVATLLDVSLGTSLNEVWTAALQQAIAALEAEETEAD